VTTHLAAPEESALSTLCGELDPGDADEVISLDEAQRADGRHFDCVLCHIRLTGGRKHSHPEG
jgi:hypothetical protein